MDVDPNRKEWIPCRAMLTGRDRCVSIRFARLGRRWLLLFCWVVFCSFAFWVVLSSNSRSLYLFFWARQEMAFALLLSWLLLLSCISFKYQILFFSGMYYLQIPGLPTWSFDEFLHNPCDDCGMKNCIANIFWNFVLKIDHAILPSCDSKKSIVQLDCRWKEIFPWVLSFVNLTWD